MPQLMTTERQQALTTGAQAADPLAALIQSAEAGTLNRPVLNQQALSLARSFLSPKDFKDLVEGLTKQQELAAGPKPDIKVAGDAIYSVAGGRATQLVAPKPEKPTQFTGEAATIALSTFGTADPTKLSPEQLAQIPKLIQDQRMAVAAAGRPSVDVKVGEGAASLLLKSQIERVNATQTAADAAAQTLRTTAGLKPLIEEGVFSGPLSGQATVVARLASSLGVTGRNTQELLNRTSEAMQGLARLELQAAEAMRGQGAITENERSLIARAAGGNLAQFTSGEVKTLLNALEKTSQFTIGSHRRQVDALRKILPEEARPYADAFTTDLTVTLTDGSTHLYENVPESVTREQVMQRASKDFSNREVVDVSRVSYAEMGPGEVALRGVAALPRSVGKMVGDIASAVMSPVQTGKAVLDVAAGTLQNILPERLVQAIGEDRAAREAASRVAQMYADRYGSVDAVKKVIATDPASFMADVSTVLTGGAMAAGRVPAVSGALSTAASYVDPLSLTAKAAGTGLRVAGSAVPNILGMTTGAGREAVEQAFQAGREGGARAQQFTENLRSQVPMTDVLGIAKQNLEQFRADRGAMYRANIANIQGDKTVLSFSGIDNALQNAFDKVMFKGKVKNQEAVDRLNEIKTMIDDWKAQNPADFHTAEGLDALKQSIGQVVEKVQPRTQADMVVKNVYNSVKSEIVKQAPTYAKTMQAYTEATDQIREIERA
jgi:hypothetical protein